MNIIGRQRNSGDIDNAAIFFDPARQIDIAS
jgi:hypothetical protein